MYCPSTYENDKGVLRVWQENTVPMPVDQAFADTLNNCVVVGISLKFFRALAILVRA